MNYEDVCFKDYKCFDKTTKLTNIKQINIIIGKNNIGKSSLLDVIEYINGKKMPGFENSEICEELELTDEILKSFFSTNTLTFINGYVGDYKSDYDKVIQYVGKKILRRINNELATKRFSMPTYINDYFGMKKDNDKWMRIIENSKRNDKHVKRIYAERDIKSEKDDENISLDGKGNGVTTIIKDYLNNSAFDEDLVRKKLLDKLNEIMGDDAKFEEITVQIIKHSKSNEWEVFLKEKNKSRIALSKSGSGLKTILLILIYTIIVPEYEKNNISSYIFMFEEIENNLHPALLRRTLKYIEETSKQGAQFFLTTHSSVMIDAFQNTEDVSIYQVKKEENETKVISLNNIAGKKNCLDDLGFKASDILQSNGIIWVEGPSDRVYINKWIELWTEGKYREGMNYQCLIYGGRLLSNMEFDECKVDKYINLLNVNKNAIMIIDSDKKSQTSEINETKKRIICECEKNNILTWVTKGREIENYIPEKVINETFAISSKNKFKQYKHISEYLNKEHKGLGDIFNKNKINYAYDFVEKMTIDNMKNSYDLNEKMQLVIERIENWNK